MIALVVMSVECERTMEETRDQAKGALAIMVSLVIMGTVVACILPKSHKVETGVLTSCLLIGLAACSLIAWATLKVSSMSKCARETGFTCDDMMSISGSMTQAINWMASIAAVWIVIHMYRSRAGPWEMIGSYVGVNLLGVLVAVLAGLWVINVLREKFPECPHDDKVA